MPGTAPDAAPDEEQSRIASQRGDRCEWVALAAGLAVLAAFASLLRGGRYVHPEAIAGSPEPQPGPPVKRGTAT